MSSLASTPTSAPQTVLARMSFSPEFELLLSCASPRDNTRADLRRQLDTSLDWPEVLRIAEHHNVMPLVYQALRQIGEAVPSATLDELCKRFENNARKNLRFMAELIRILDCLDSHGITAIPFKGPVLAEAVYGNLALREFSDLDILVRPSDFPAAKAALRQLTYAPVWDLSPAEERAYRATGYECAFDGPAGRNLLELQWRILPWFYAVDFDIEGFFQRALHTSFEGRAIRMLSSEDLLLVLCAHATKHAWIRLCWLRDIAGVSQSSSLDWDVLWRRARTLGIVRIVRLSLSLASRLLGAEFPHLQHARDDAEIEGLCNRIAQDIAHSGLQDTESLGYFRLMLQLRERWSDRVRFFLRLLFTPSIGEWSLVRLPAPLFPLYRGIRLLRVAGRVLPFGHGRTAGRNPESE